MSAGALVEHLFRHEAGRMVSTLVRLLGPQQLDLAEESVQDALLRALEVWPFRGVPDNPTAWLIQTARNKALDRLRQSALTERKAAEILAAFTPATREERVDDVLAMLFFCCHPALPRESQVALALKTVCGFSTAEIARAFLLSEDAATQRIVRAKRRIREERLRFDQHGPLAAVLEVLYLLFNQGYAPLTGNDPIRADLCDEAIRLARILTGPPEANALLSLFLLQSARLPARLNPAGDLLLLRDQDRSRWDQARIAEGFAWLERSACGDRQSHFHAEAAIAAAHCRPEVDWPFVLSLYDRLYALKPTPVVALNRAVALAEVGGAAAALEALPELPGYAWLEAVRAELLARCGRHSESRAARARAIQLAPTPADRRLLQKIQAASPTSDTADKAAPQRTLSG